MKSQAKELLSDNLAGCSNGSEHENEKPAHQILSFVCQFPNSWLKRISFGALANNVAVK